MTHSSILTRAADAKAKAAASADKDAQAEAAARAKAEALAKAEHDRKAERHLAAKAQRESRGPALRTRSVRISHLDAPCPPRANNPASVHRITAHCLRARKSPGAAHTSRDYGAPLRLDRESPKRHPSGSGPVAA